ncbi:MAG: SLBB domain-containing protein [Gemmatimonadota bacterium]
MRSAFLISPIRLRHTLAVLTVTLGCGASAVRAQAPAEQTLYRTRPFLDSVATALEKSGKSSEAAAIRERLKVGDFYPGDRLVVEMFGSEEPLRDTVSVRAGQEVNLGQLPAFSLRGVLRSEADSALVAQAKRYIQRPVIRTQPLGRLLVTGAVGRPGFVTVRGDAAVSDVVNAAGGLTNASRLNKSKIKRGSETLVEADSLATIFRSGMTLDQADIRAGDEIAISEKKQGGFTGMIWAASAAIGVILSLVSLAR